MSSSFKLMAKTQEIEFCSKWHLDHAQKMPIIQDMDGVLIMIWIRTEINLQLMQRITFYIS